MTFTELLIANCSIPVSSVGVGRSLPSVLALYPPLPDCTFPVPDPGQHAARRRHLMPVTQTKSLFVPPGSSN